MALSKANVLTEMEVVRMLAAQEARLEIQTRNTAAAVARDHAMSVVERHELQQDMLRRQDMARASLSNPYWMPSTANAVWYNGLIGGPPGLGGSLSNAMAVQQAPVAVIDMPDMAEIETVPVEVKQEDLDDMGKQFATEVEALLGYTNLRKKVNAPSPLRLLMAKLEIEVLNADQVMAYKVQAKGHMRTAKKMSDPTWTVTPLADYHQDIPHFVLSKAVEIKKEMPEARFFVDHLQEDPFLIVTTAKVTEYGLTGRHGTLGERAKKGDDTLYLEVWNEKSFEQSL